MKITFEDGEIESVCEMLADYFRLVATSAQLRTLIEAADLVRIIHEGPTDTHIRGLAIDCVVHSLGLGHWPLNGEGQDAFDRFWPDYVRAVEARGMSIRTEGEDSP